MIDPKREEYGVKLLKNLPTTTPAMREALKSYAHHQTDFQQFWQSCDEELQRVKREQDESEY